ncbi:MAG: hypothetical protein ABI760_00965 [Ferruginibacter sp.]
MKKANRILLVDDDADDQPCFRDAINELHKSLHCEIMAIPHVRFA